MTASESLVIEEGSRVRLRVLEPDELVDAEPSAAVAERPRTRGDCITGTRPCPWVGCRHHLFLEVSDAGTIRPNHSGEPGDMPPDRSCALDVAARGDLTLGEIGALFGVSGDRMREIERAALVRFGLRGGARLAELADADLDDRLR